MDRTNLEAELQAKDKEVRYYQLINTHTYTQVNNNSSIQ